MVLSSRPGPSSNCNPHRICGAVMMMLRPSAMEVRARITYTRSTCNRHQTRMLTPSDPTCMRARANASTHSRTHTHTAFVPTRIHTLANVCTVSQDDARNLQLSMVPSSRPGPSSNCNPHLIRGAVMMMQRPSAMEVRAPGWV